ncbi:hypothetical protein [Sphaerospermopsis sp. LEGE 08334]|jgi:cell shape-determining protein MreD|uniref:hypothetical protein n=1 Tax=Sphaerospermopsis sp. LEGE 08334 TaxID=1828651 RepID=UPI001881871B|nr:hypothetical protein [Sphaerospermopsis sp. LEGE 08334]MBE9058182.1 hypothetical protein [Sphaerospermopsis sp. LEGE 08334]
MELIIIGLIVTYVFGGLKFWLGFKKTHFTQTFLNRIGFSLLWPVLFIANSSYRRNFRRALRD